MSRTKKTLTRQTLVRAFFRVANANVSNSWAGSGDPADIPHIKRELVLASDRANEIIDTVFAERAELVGALNEALELHMGMLHSDYTSRHIEAAEKGEVGRLRTVAAKYWVKS